jgi:hypothetical protein
MLRQYPFALYPPASRSTDAKTNFIVNVIIKVIADACSDLNKINARYTEESTNVDLRVNRVLIAGLPHWGLGPHLSRVDTDAFIAVRDVLSPQGCRVMIRRQRRTKGVDTSDADGARRTREIKARHTIVRRRPTPRQHFTPATLNSTQYFHSAMCLMHRLLND